VRGVCLSVCLSVTAAQLARLYCEGVIRCSLCQITLASCSAPSLTPLTVIITRSKQRRLLPQQTAIRYDRWLTRSCRCWRCIATCWRRWRTDRRSALSSPYRRTCSAEKATPSCGLWSLRWGSARSANTCELRTIRRLETTPADCLCPDKTVKHIRHLKPSSLSCFFLEQHGRSELGN